MLGDITRWGFTDVNRLDKIVKKEIHDPSRYTPEEFIAAAERALIKHPDEWVIYYFLADKYQNPGHFAEAIIASKKCVEIRPNDIRSVYVHANSYMQLAYTAFEDRERYGDILLRMIIDNEIPFHKKPSQFAMDQFGLTIETSATLAINWFERALTLNPDEFSRGLIEISIRGLQQRLTSLYDRKKGPSSFEANNNKFIAKKSNILKKFDDLSLADISLFLKRWEDSYREIPSEPSEIIKGWMHSFDTGYLMEVTGKLLEHNLIDDGERQNILTQATAYSYQWALLCCAIGFEGFIGNIEERYVPFYLIACSYPYNKYLLGFLNMSLKSNIIDREYVMTVGTNLNKRIDSIE